MEQQTQQHISEKNHQIPFYKKPVHQRTSQPHTLIVQDSHPPQKKFVAGAISATIWKNEKHIQDTEFEITSVSLQKNYKDKDGNWKTTHSFKTNDIPKVKLVLDKAYEYLTLKGESA
jgi:hypothetical protein